MSESANILSELIQVYPAVRRDSLYFNSRLLTEDNYRRLIEMAFYNQSGNENHGSVIVKVNYSTIYTHVDRIQFCLRGYYFDTSLASGQSTGNDLITKINEALEDTNDAYVSAIISQTSTTVSETGNSLNELNCSDGVVGETCQFTGISVGEELTSDEWEWGIQLVVPNPKGSSEEHHNIINPALCLDPSDTPLGSGTYGEENYFYIDLESPYFISNFNFATSDWAINTLKKKLWIDNTYYVPHIYTNLSTPEQMWKPLGAAYKSWTT